MSEDNKTAEQSTSTTTTTTAVDEQLLKSVREQVEFYFSDSNLPRDAFLRSLVQKNKDGYVPVDTIASFKKLANLTKDRTIVLQAIRSSESIEASEDGKQVRRRSAVPSDASQVVFNRSIYAKGFPQETTIDDVKQYFSEQGNVRSVRLRRRRDKLFKGSVFVEFDNNEVANKVAAMELKYKDAPLLLHTKAAYVEKKKIEIAEKKKKNEENKSDEPKKRKAEGDAADGEEEEDKNGGAESKKEEKKEEKKEDYLPKRIVKFSGLAAETEWKSLKTLLNGKNFAVRYIEPIANGSTNVRFSDSVNTEAMIEQFANDKIEVNGVVPTLALVSGDEEKKFWDELKAKNSSSSSNNNNNYHNKRGKNFRNKRYKR